MRRPFVFLVILLCALTGWPAVPTGHVGPSPSGDLLTPGLADERVRVSVQAHGGMATSASPASPNRPFTEIGGLWIQGRPRNRPSSNGTFGSVQARTVFGFDLRSVRSAFQQSSKIEQ